MAKKSKDNAARKPKAHKKKLQSSPGVVKKSKTTQIKKNKDAGSRFEAKVTVFINDYFEVNNITGLAYRFPAGRAQNQPIDILLDSEIGFYGIECKSIFTESLDNGKIYFSKLGNINAAGLHQLQAQHDFLETSYRGGIIAIQFRDLREIYLVPHIDIVTIYESGELSFTVAWVQNTYQELRTIDIREYLRNL